MPSKTTDVATRFVDLALKYKQWGEVRAISVDEVQILMDTISAAGFHAKDISVGRLIGSYRNRDGSSIGDTYQINSFCPFKIIGENGDHHFATGWLDCALRCVVCGETQQNNNREKLIEMMAEEIKRSVPLEPIQLTPEGDFLREYPPNKPMFGHTYFVRHTRDEDSLVSCVGVHEFCNSWLHRLQVTKTHDVIVCRNCCLRVLFPREVKTYGELRQALGF